VYRQDRAQRGEDRDGQPDAIGSPPPPLAIAQGGEDHRTPAADGLLRRAGGPRGDRALLDGHDRRLSPGQQKYIQSLGFGTSRRPIDNRPQAVRINQFGQDNSFATDHPKNELRFGKGGVDDAEDAEVILHEYGHAIHFAQNFSFASEQAGAISEGFADYWAVTVADVVSRALGVPEQEPLPCVADWDSTSYTTVVPHCLRRVDTNLHFPGDLNGEVHHDGQIWSRALWDIRQALGNVRADTIILQGSFDFPGTTMPDLARSTVAAAQQLYGNAAANVVTQAFTDRGIL
jgi:zinc metalloprotease ZmpB